MPVEAWNNDRRRLDDVAPKSCGACTAPEVAAVSGDDARDEKLNPCAESLARR